MNVSQIPRAANRAKRWILLLSMTMAFGLVCFGQPDDETARTVEEFKRIALRAHENSIVARTRLDTLELRLAQHHIEYENLRLEYKWHVKDTEDKNKRMQAQMRTLRESIQMVEKERNELIDQVAENRREMAITRKAVDSLTIESGIRQIEIANLRNDIDSLTSRVKDILVESMRGSIYFFVKAEGRKNEFVALIDSGKAVQREYFRKGREKIYFRTTVTDGSVEFRLKYQIVNVDDPTTGTTEPVFEAAHDAPVIAERSEDINSLNINKLKLFHPKKFLRGNYMLKYQILVMTGIGADVQMHEMERVRFSVK